ncbi:MAG: hypothetical protein IJX89_03260, partial [Alphaproteobacteria bacterium]|nr:hypothetical protein [Alphaproteobacteria bacterium]
GKAGLFVNTGPDEKLDTAEYASHMLRVIECVALRTKMGILSYGRYKERYTSRKMIKDTVNLYERLVK